MSVTKWIVAAAVAVAVTLTVLTAAVPGVDFPTTAAARSSRARLERKLQAMNYNLDRSEDALTGLEDRDDETYRSLFGLPGIKRSDKTVVCVPDSSGIPGLDASRMRLEKLLVRAAVQDTALDKAAVYAAHVGRMTTAVPSIPPLLPREGEYHISSPFGARIDPVFGDIRFHKGQDLGSDRGKPVYATGDGVVEIAGYHNNGYGNEVLLNHDYGFKTRYAHLDSIFVKEGTMVKRGQVLGLVGSTGKSTGPHLHYEVYYMDKPVNPMKFLDFSIGEEAFLEIIAQ